jgi:hypothetical protein
MHDDVLLAQVNVSRPRGELNEPVMAGFVANFDLVARGARRSPGFVWQHEGDGPHGATALQHEGGLLVVNLSLWKSYEALHRFVYVTRHGGMVRRRSDWFLPVAQPSTALWWVPADDRPTVPAALRRLHHLRTHGPAPQAFSLRRRFLPDGRPEPRLPKTARA